MSITYRIAVTEHYVMRAQQATLDRDAGSQLRARRKQWLRWAVRLGLAVLLVFMIRLHDWSGVALVALGLAGSFAAPLLAQRSLRKARQHAAQSPGELMISVDEQGIDAANSGARDRLPWSAFAGASVHPDGVLLNLQSRKWFWLPDAALTDGTPAQVRDLLDRALKGSIA
jgi:hypothetical protein